ncbi:type IV pilin protein [Kaarinaea lacus]
MFIKKSARCLNQSSVAGITLIELLITIAILGILSAIMVPSYSGYLNKSRRTDAKIALADAVKNMERCFATYNQYNHASCLSYPAGAGSVLSDEGHYKVVATTLTQTTFTLTATPLPSSPQNKDDYCKLFSIDSTGIKNATNADCW